jgi:hypothetical protein
VRSVALTDAGSAGAAIPVSTTSNSFPQPAMPVPLVDRIKRPRGSERPGSAVSMSSRRVPDRAVEAGEAGDHPTRSVDSASRRPDVRVEHSMLGLAARIIGEDEQDRRPLSRPEAFARTDRLPDGGRRLLAGPSRTGASGRRAESTAGASARSGRPAQPRESHLELRVGTED